MALQLHRHLRGRAVAQGIGQALLDYPVEAHGQAVGQAIAIGVGRRGCGIQCSITVVARAGFFCVMDVMAELFHDVADEH